VHPLARGWLRVGRRWYARAVATARVQTGDLLELIMVRRVAGVRIT
jgi:hypothetical protein